MIKLKNLSLKTQNTLGIVKEMRAFRQLLNRL